MKKRNAPAIRRGAAARAGCGQTSASPGSRPYGRQGRRGRIARGHAGRGHGHGHTGLVRHVVELLYCAVLVLGAEHGFARAPEGGRVRRLNGGVGVRVQRQNPRLGQQRPHEAEQ